MERPEQQRFLEEIGTTAVQCYLYQRAVPAVQLDTWLDAKLATAGRSEKGGPAAGKVTVLRPKIRAS